MLSQTGMHNLNVWAQSLHFNAARTRRLNDDKQSRPLELREYDNS